MRKIGGILNGFLLKRELYLKIKGNLSVLKWEEVVGKKLSDFTYPLSYKDGVLIIGVINPMLERELNYIKQDIIDKINKLIPDSPVKRLRFKVIEKMPIRIRAAGENAIHQETIELEESDLIWINDVLKSAKIDSKLKKKYKELLIAYKTDQKRKIKKGFKKCKKCRALFKGRGLLCPVCKIQDKKR